MEVYFSFLVNRKSGNYIAEVSFSLSLPIILSENKHSQKNFASITNSTRHSPYAITVYSTLSLLPTFPKKLTPKCSQVDALQC